MFYYHVVCSTVRIMDNHFSSQLFPLSIMADIFPDAWCHSRQYYSFYIKGIIIANPCLSFDLKYLLSRFTNQRFLHLIRKLTRRIINVHKYTPRYQPQKESMLKIFNNVLL